MSFDPRSPSDRADMEPEYALTCPYSDEISDDGEICGSCAIDRAEFRYGRAVPTTCVETIGGDPETALRLSFQIKVF